MVIRSEMQAKMLRYNTEQNKFIGQTLANLHILHIHYNQMFVVSSKTVHNPWFCAHSLYTKYIPNNCPSDLMDSFLMDLDTSVR